MAKEPQQVLARATPPTAEAYNAVVDSAALEQVRLVKSEFEISGPGFGEVQSDWTFHTSCVVEKYSFVPDDEVLAGFVTAQAFCKVGRKKVVNLRCQYIVIYSIDGKPEESAASTFLKRVGNFAVYPYFRSHFATLTSGAGVTLPPLPILKEGRRPIPRAKRKDVDTGKVSARKN